MDKRSFLKKGITLAVVTRMPQLPLSGTDLHGTLAALRHDLLVNYASLSTLIADADLTAGDRCSTPEGIYDIIVPNGLVPNGSTVIDLPNARCLAVLAKAESLNGLPSLKADTRDYSVMDPGDVISTSQGISFEVLDEFVTEADIILPGGLKLRALPNQNGEFVANAFGAAIDATTDDGPALRAMVKAGGLSRIPAGVIYLNSEITGERSDKSWNGMQGIGHESVIKLGPNGRIKLQNLLPGGALGTDHGLCSSLRDFAIDGDFIAPYGVIVGSNIDEGETSIQLTANYQQFENVSIMDVAGPAWACGYLTANVWTKCYTKDCHYGWRFVTNTNDSASDVWHLTSCDIRSHDIAGLVAFSSSPNTVSGSATGCFITENTGWGAFFANTGSGFDSYTLINAHFEKNGVCHYRPALTVTVPEYGGTMEPGAAFIDGCNVTMIGCVNVGNFFRVQNGGVLTLQGGQLMRGTYQAGGKLPLFKDCDASSRIILEGGIGLLNPGTSTVATLEYNGEVRMMGSENDAAFLCGRAPRPVLYGGAGLSTDPEFTYSSNGLGSSTNSPPVRTLDTTDSVTGSQSLKVTFNAWSANSDGNSNLLRWDNQIGALGANDYLAICFYAKAETATTIRLNVYTSEYGNNLGTPSIDLPADEWVRVSVLYRTLPGAAANPSLLIYPGDAAGSSVNFDCFEAAKGASFTDVAHVLRGNIGCKVPIFGSVSWSVPPLVNGGQATSPAVSIPGLTLGTHTLQVVPPYSTQGMLTAAYINGPEEAYIVLNNFTGATIDLTTGTWRVRADPV